MALKRNVTLTIKGDLRHSAYNICRFYTLNRPSHRARSRHKPYGRLGTYAVSLLKIGGDFSMENHTDRLSVVQEVYGNIIPKARRKVRAA
ncbi:hypothetical protein D3C72_1994870 [compost metagenome]